ncbi:MAG TPA: hypothetical protein VHA52_01965, partial [Candidatus Babeliaceae bacterium]|nr:hypothetical protein [Candidatus Babeliaceae bacterium]
MIRKVYKLVESKLPISANFVNNIIESLLQLTASPMLNQINIKNNITEIAIFDNLIVDTLFHDI